MSAFVKAVADALCVSGPSHLPRPTVDPRPWKEQYPHYGDELHIDVNGVRVIGKVTCTACPLQIEGDLGELGVFYFRARHDQTRLSVGATLTDAVRANIDSDGHVAWWDHDDWETRGQVIEAISDHLSYYFRNGGGR